MRMCCIMARACLVRRELDGEKAREVVQAGLDHTVHDHAGRRVVQRAQAAHVHDRATLAVLHSLHSDLCPPPEDPSTCTWARSLTVLYTRSKYIENLIILVHICIFGFDAPETHSRWPSRPRCSVFTYTPAHKYNNWSVLIDGDHSALRIVKVQIMYKYCPVLGCTVLYCT